MKAQRINDYIYCIHTDVKTPDLFEGIWPVPGGVSLNSYLVKGEKTALIDLFRDWNGAAGRTEKALADAGIGFAGVDYLVLNHLEPDHSGWLREFREKNPRAEIVSTAKGLALVKSFYKIDGGLREAKNGDTLDLGGGKILTFFETPNVHWPETMVTYEAASGTLFSCDAFGSYGALGENVFDDQVENGKHVFFEDECLRYYATIVSSFSVFVERAIEKLSVLDIRCVAPSHGIVWRRDPGKIIRRYAKYASWAKGPAEKEIAVVWGSMYGNTRAGLDAALRGIEKEGVPYSLHRVPDENISYVLAAAWKSSGLLIAMPTYEYAMFPPVAHTLDILRRKHVFGKKALRVGSWGWSGGAQKEYDAALANLKWDSLASVEWAGYPAEADLAALEESGRELARKVKNL